MTMPYGLRRSQCRFWVGWWPHSWSRSITYGLTWWRCRMQRKCACTFPQWPIPRHCWGHCATVLGSQETDGGDKTSCLSAGQLSPQAPQLQLLWPRHRLDVQPDQHNSPHTGRWQHPPVNRLLRMLGRHQSRPETGNPGKEEKLLNCAIRVKPHSIRNRALVDTDTLSNHILLHRTCTQDQVSVTTCDEGQQQHCNGHAALGSWTDPWLHWHINCIELLAVLLALWRFRPLIQGKHLLVRTYNTATVLHCNTVEYINHQSSFCSCYM